MDRIVIVPPRDEIMPPQQKKGRRGARPYGLPLSKELLSYLEDIAPNFSKNQALDMFFVGRFFGMTVANTFNEDDLDDDDQLMDEEP